MERICLLDGGTGRELLRIGAPFGQPEWSARALMEAPQFVTRVHEAFVAAGYYEDEYGRSGAGWQFRLHREVPFYFVKLKEGWAGPKPRIMAEWARKS